MTHECNENKTPLKCLLNQKQTFIGLVNVSHNGQNTVTSALTYALSDTNSEACNKGANT